MKSTIIFLAVLFTLPVLGQTHYIGIKGGVNWTNIITDDFTDGRNNRTGMTSGLTYEFAFKSNIHLGLDVLYTQKGFENIMTFTDENGEIIGTGPAYINNYNYLSLPIKGGFSVGNKLKGFLSAGLVPSFLLHANTTTPDIGSIEKETIDVTEYVTPFDFGGLVEIGSSYTLHENLLLYTSFSYQQSFTSYTNDNYFADVEARHYGLYISLGMKYAFPF